MNPAICYAIENRFVLEFHYAGGTRIVEPYRHGRSTAGNEVLWAYQVSGYSHSGNPSGWKLFDVAKMRELRSTGQTFPHNRPGYVPKDRAMRFTHCQI